MDDAHQVITIITTAICEFFKDRADGHVDIEEARILSKQIIAASPVPIGLPNERPSFVVATPSS